MGGFFASFLAAERRLEALESFKSRWYSSGVLLLRQRLLASYAAIGRQMSHDRMLLCPVQAP